MFCVQEIQTNTKITGQVSNCTLINPLHHKLQTKSGNNSRKICSVHFGMKSISEAIDTCKALNARLPLPSNNKENQSLLNIIKSDYNITTGNVHLGISDKLQSGTVRYFT